MHEAEKDILHHTQLGIVLPDHTPKCKDYGLVFSPELIMQ